MIDAILSGASFTLGAIAALAALNCLYRALWAAIDWLDGAYRNTCHYRRTGCVYVTLPLAGALLWWHKVLRRDTR